MSAVGCWYRPRSPQSGESPRASKLDGHANDGIVTETEGPARGVNYRHGSALLRPTSLPAAGHPARDLALSPVHTELPGRGGATGRARPGGFLETVRRWVLKFGPGFARRLRRSR